jgi:hypothetical protein
LPRFATRFCCTSHISQDTASTVSVTINQVDLRQRRAGIPRSKDTAIAKLHMSLRGGGRVIVTVLRPCFRRLSQHLPTRPCLGNRSISVLWRSGFILPHILRSNSRPRRITELYVFPRSLSEQERAADIVADIVADILCIIPESHIDTSSCKEARLRWNEKLRINTRETYLTVNLYHWYWPPWVYVDIRGDSDLSNGVSILLGEQLFNSPPILLPIERGAYFG